MPDNPDDDRVVACAVAAGVDTIISGDGEFARARNNPAREATFTRTPDGKYRVAIDVDAKKFRADDIGNETEVRMDDLVDVGVFLRRPKGGAMGPASAHAPP